MREETNACHKGNLVQLGLEFYKGKESVGC